MEQQAQTQTFVESRWKKFWRPVAAYVYLFIILMDFAIMPGIYERHDNYSHQEIIASVSQLKDPQVQIAAIGAFTQKRTWEPLTSTGGGLIHIAFGTILGIAAWTRGQEKIEYAKKDKYLV